jgi:adenylate kinase
MRCPTVRKVSEKEDRLPRTQVTEPHRMQLDRCGGSSMMRHDPEIRSFSACCESEVRRTAPRLVIAGCPGAGKGTQGTRLARRLGVQHLSTGDLLRDAIAMQSSLGCAVERLVRAGRLVPTGLIVAIVEASVDTNGYVLDGFPRTVLQAEALFERENLAPTITIEIVVPMGKALARLVARGRADDDADVARDRLAIYESETLPALALLDRNTRLVRVDGDDLPHVVERRVMQAFVQVCRSNDTPSPANLRADISSRNDATVLAPAFAKQDDLWDNGEPQAT